MCCQGPVAKQFENIGLNYFFFMEIERYQF